MSETTIRYMIELLGRLPSKNDWTNWHWSKRGAEKKNWEEQAFYLCKQAQIPKLAGRLELQFIFYFEKGTKVYDIDNLEIKWIVDGIKWACMQDDKQVYKTSSTKIENASRDSIQVFIVPDMTGALPIKKEKEKRK